MLLFSQKIDIGKNVDRDHELKILAYAKKKIYHSWAFVELANDGLQSGHSGDTTSWPRRYSTQNKIEIFGEVNSYHNFGILDCPKGYRVISGVTTLLRL